MGIVEGKRLGVWVKLEAVAQIAGFSKLKAC